MSERELTDEQVEELRRAVEGYESYAAEIYADGREPTERERGLLLARRQMYQGLATSYRHAILASLDRLQAMRRRMKKGVG